MSKIDYINNAQDTDQPLVLSPQNGDALTLPNNAFIADADISRDGLDLVLSLDNGESVIIEGYFAVETPPLLMSEGGAALTPQLVDSFTHNPTFANAGGMTDASPVGGVKEVSGEATVTRTDGTVETITLGTPIYEGDIVETSDDGAVNIMFIDETEFAVSEDARLAIDEYVFDPSTSEGSTNFSVLRGVFVFTSGIIGRDDPDDVEIETPVGSIGIRGTIIAGKIDAEGGDNQITVVEGAIVVRNGFGETTLSTQFETVQLGGFNSEITNIGTLDATQMNQSFGAVSGVSGSLFSAINDTSFDQQGGDAGAPQDDGQAQQEAGGEDHSSEDGTTDGAADAADGDGEDSSAAQPDSAPENVQDGEAAPEATAEGGEQPASTDAAAPEPTQQPTQQPTTGLESGLGGPNGGLGGTTGTSGTTGGTQPQTGGPKPLATAKPAPNNGGDTTNNNTDATTQQTTTDVLPPLSTTQPPPSTTDPNNTTGTVSGPFILNLADNTQLSARGFNVGTAGVATGIGESITALGDIDGDGKGDFAFSSANGYLMTHKSDSGVSAFDLRTPIAGDVNNNITVSGGGDFDGDGELDLIVGAPGANIDWNSDGDFMDANESAPGQIGLFEASGNATNTTVTNDSTSYAPASSMMGMSVAALGDFDSDGYSDYAIGIDAFLGGNGGILIGYGYASSLSAGLDTGSFDHVEGDAASGQLLGDTMSAAGDIDNDGFDDFIVGATDGNAYIVYGGTGTPTKTAIAHPGGAFSEFGDGVVGGGDVNRDGFSDFIVASEHAAHLYLGNASTPTLATTFTTSRAGWNINGGDMIGDFNGDGIDDLTFITSDENGGNDIFVLFGRPAGFGTEVDLNFENLSDFDEIKGFAMIWNGVGDTTELTVSSVGDVNGDGLDDIAIGAADAGTTGAVKIVYGHATPITVTDGDVRDGDASANNITATNNGQALLGNEANNVIDGGTFDNLSVSAGNGDDIIKLHSAGVTHKTINGGGGYDVLELSGAGGVLDFTAAGAGGNGMTLSNIEKIILKDGVDGGVAQEVILDSNNLFELLRNSDDNILKIVGNTSSNTEITIKKNGADINLSSLGFTNDADADSNVDIVTDGAITYNKFTHEGYTLLVDQNVSHQYV